MGTNYYIKENPCPTCGHGEEVHIGKSSAGWCFALRVYPDKGINTLEDWKPLFENGNIRTEYDSPVSPAEMLDEITNRSRERPPAWSDAEWKQNCAEPGPNNMIRASLSYNCIGHGDGPWDYIAGEFC